MISSSEKKYLNEFWKLSCAKDLFLSKAYPNVKEITESFAAFNAVARYISNFDFSDPDVTVVCVADGNTPRTGIVFALRTKWNVISIDPALKNKSSWHFVNRLTVIPEKLEDVVDMYFKKVIIVCVHSHVLLPVVLNKIRGDERAIVSIPCCFKQQIPNKLPDYDFNDQGIWSEKNRVMIWESV